MIVGPGPTGARRISPNVVMVCNIIDVCMASAVAGLLDNTTCNRVLAINFEKPMACLSGLG